MRHLRQFLALVLSLGTVCVEYKFSGCHGIQFLACKTVLVLQFGNADDSFLLELCGKPLENLITLGESSTVKDEHDIILPNDENKHLPTCETTVYQKSTWLRHSAL